MEKVRENLHERDVRQSSMYFSVRSVSNAREPDIYILFLLHFKKKYAFHLTICLMHRLAGGFVCYKYVTDMSNLTYLFTDLLYFFSKNTDRFYRVL